MRKQILVIAFLLAAGRALVERGLSPSEAVRGQYGVDLDPLEEDDRAFLIDVLHRHLEETGSTVAIAWTLPSRVLRRCFE